MRKGLIGFVLGIVVVLAGIWIGYAEGALPIIRVAELPGPEWDELLESEQNELPKSEWRKEPGYQVADLYSYVPDGGYVQDADTAIKIAEAIWIPIYGEKQIYSEKPYYVTLLDGIWYVSGTLPKGMQGRVARIAINKGDGKIQS